MRKATYEQRSQPILTALPTQAALLAQPALIKSLCTTHAPHPCTDPLPNPPPRHLCHMHRISTVGEEARLEFPRARPHRRRCHLLRCLCSEHHEALRGEQAGGRRPSHRLPAAVAAGAPGLQLPRGPLDEAARRSLHPALCPYCERCTIYCLLRDRTRQRDAQRHTDRGRERL